MNPDGMPSLWVQTVCVYSVIGLLESDAPAGSVSNTNHTLARKEGFKLPAGKDRIRARLSDTTKRGLSPSFFPERHGTTIRQALSLIQIASAPFDSPAFLVYRARHGQ
jgi:hypothetical protein